jgi:UDP:flavonoid glycosyltransferase YjiC (YdhE family)
MRILLATIGSLGDLHPVLGLGIELRGRGHSVTIATSEAYRPAVEATSLSFGAIRPNLILDPKRIWYLFNRRRGPERLIRDFIMPTAREMFEDLLPLVESADVLVASELIYPAAAISEVSGIPWLSLILAPASFLSIYDPPVIPPAPFLHGLRHLGPWTHFVLNGLFRLGTWNWFTILRRLRRELGLSSGRHPLFDAKHSPYGSLATFSACFGSPQSDWPRSAIQTGFIFFDGAHQIPESFHRYLNGGEPPVVFTLGSSAVHVAGDFYNVAFEAIRKLGCRAVFLLGENAAPQTSSSDFYFSKYIPFSLVFPKAVAVVHQGGIGTCAQTLLAGCPSLVMPFGFDQLDNAHRMQRLGVARSLSRARLCVNTMVRELGPLLTSAEFKTKALEVSREIARENGARVAAMAIESVRLSRPSA